MKREIYLELYWLFNDKKSFQSDPLKWMMISELHFFTNEMEIFLNNRKNIKITFILWT